MTENLTLQELKAYRKLQGEPFDFGDGLMYPEANESDDVYYKTTIRNIEDYNRNTGFKRKNKPKISQYELNLLRKSQVLRKRKLDSRHKRKKYNKKMKDKAILKSLSNRKVRKYDLNHKISKGSEYKKIYGSVESWMNWWW